MSKPKAIVINLSTSGKRLGGAAVAAEWHSRFMAPKFNVELWRMWENDEEFYIDELKVRNFSTKANFGIFGQLLPKKIRGLFLDSTILDNILAIHPDIIHLQNPLPALAFEKIAHQASSNGIKVVVSTHGFYEVMNPNYGLKGYQRWAWKQGITQPIIRALNSVDAVLSGYPNEKEMLIEKGVSQDKIYLVPNGINPFFLTPPSSEDCSTVLEKFGISQEKPILLFIGNHTGNKGLETVLKVASCLSQPASVVIGGKLLTPDEPLQWQQKIPSASDVDVIFTDYLTLSEQKSLYHLSTILLFPSMADTLPLTILEAMASELPVIAYDVGGISYQLTDNCGIVIKPADFHAFHTAVEQLIDNNNLREKIFQNAKIRQRQLFSWNIAAQNTVEIYQTILQMEKYPKYNYTIKIN
ncbi:MAG: glycosyltransferase family 4 protein [Nostoc sp. NOS(2021)]|uniref:glycosyltransferase family 4 protein n=1 Tax=Nostoc sp. NOS(2021) TaxID=2815407 RepID=UPI0025F721A2|nr:glycosyltransferase family 4 protein [Nostoc sp. NOS(2021)]MBN3894906.1 glycosyltransferase family 4 protein [Nostoc sp. NOS(2021)]